MRVAFLALLAVFCYEWAAHVSQKETQNVEGTVEGHVIKAVATLGTILN